MELIQQLEAWNKAHKFSQGIAAIEAIPEEERGFLLTLWLGRLYSNLAVLGDYPWGGGGGGLCRQPGKGLPAGAG